MYESLTTSIADVQRMQRTIDDIAVLLRVIDQGGSVCIGADGLATKVKAEPAAARSLLVSMTETMAADMAKTKAALDAADAALKTGGV